VSLGVAIRRSRVFSLLSRLTAPFRHRVDVACVYHRDLRGDLTQAVSEVPVVMSRATEDDVREAALMAGPQFVQPFLARLSDGMACFVAKLDGKVVGYNWTRYESGLDEGDVIELGPGEVYTTDCLIDPALRGKRIHGVTLGHMLQVAKELGYVDAYTMRSELKRASRKAMPGLGWRVSGRYLKVRAGRYFRVIPLTGSPHPFYGAPASAPSRRDSAAAPSRTRTQQAP
jgi:GNAT superfamily N-acetyltransferase